MGKKDQATKDAERNRKGEAASNRRLRWKTTGESNSVELQAEAMLAEQRKRPGHVDSGGVNDAEAMAEQDRQTGVKNTEAGKALEAVRKKQIEAVQGKSQTSADAVANGANAVMPSPPLQTPDNTPATTPPVAQGGAGNGKPAVPEWQQKRTAALEALRGKFTKQDAANALAKELEPKGIDPLYQASKETLDMESKFKAMIADRPADQKAMFEALPEKEKAAMVQKNESLKMVREEEAKLGPDKSSNVEQAKALRDNRTLTPEMQERSDRDASSVAYGKKAVADATAAEPDIAARDKYFADKNVGIEKEYQADKIYYAQVAEDRKAWFEDVKKNSDDFLAVGGFKRHVTGIRKDAPMPHMQADGVTTIPRNENSGNRYKSQYDKDGNFTESPSKPSPTKEVVQKNNQVVADDFSAYEGQSPLGMAVAEVIPTILKTPLLMGEKVLETLVHDYNTKGDPEAAKIAQSAYAQERVTDLRARAEKIDTSSVFGKTKKANLLKAAREFESTIIKPKSNTQASIDNKLQQHHASIDASKGVLKGARKITDDIWGSSYATVVG